MPLVCAIYVWAWDAKTWLENVSCWISGCVLWLCIGVSDNVCLMICLRDFNVHIDPRATECYISCCKMWVAWQMLCMSSHCALAWICTVKSNASNNLSVICCIFLVVVEMLLISKDEDVHCGGNALVRIQDTFICCVPGISTVLPFQPFKYSRQKNILSILWADNLPFSESWRRDTAACPKCK